MRVRALRDHFFNGLRKENEEFDYVGPLYRHIAIIDGSTPEQVAAPPVISKAAAAGPTRIRFRTDGNHWADLKAGGLTAEQFREEWKETGVSAEEFEATPKAEPGDTWRIQWYASEGEGPLAGYAICCPGCGRLHYWTTANNCKPCTHSGKSSCWQWTGSAEQGTLTARPSLLSNACGWHGFLTDGEMNGC